MSLIDCIKAFSFLLDVSICLIFTSLIFTLIKFFIDDKEDYSNLGRVIISIFLTSMASLLHSILLFLRIKYGQ